MKSKYGAPRSAWKALLTTHHSLLTLLIVSLLFALAPHSAQAQRARKAKKTVKAEKPAPQPEESVLMLQMLESIQDIMVIDSMVVPADSLLGHLTVNPEEGHIMPTAHFLNLPEATPGTAYINALGDKCIFSRPDKDGTLRLYTCNNLAGQWDKPVLAAGLEEFTAAHHPYLMPDGQTLFFCAKSEEQCLGGYDLFRTRYDAETGRFLKPENLGLPFNSEADDLLYIIDEQHALGWFATTRRQPQGRVCIYTFVPQEVRHTLATDNLTPEQTRQRAALSRIADTWSNNQLRLDAIQRVRELNAPAATATHTDHSWQLVINNQKVITQTKQCTTVQGKKLLNTWLTLKQQQDELRKQIATMRQQYEKANTASKNNLTPTILKKEREDEQLSLKIKQTEKEIRKAEGNFNF